MSNEEKIIELLEIQNELLTVLCALWGAVKEDGKRVNVKSFVDIKIRGNDLVAVIDRENRYANRQSWTKGK